MIAVNAASQLIALGAILVIQTLYMVVVARVLGPADFGLFSFAWSIVQILLIGGDLGLHNTALRLISSDRASSRRITPVFLGLKLLVAFLLFGVVAALAAVVHLGPATRMMLLIFGLGMAVQSLSMGMNVISQSHDRLYFASLNLTLIFALQAVFGVLFLYFGGRLEALAAAYLLANLLAAAVNFTIVRTRIHPLKVSLRGGLGFARRAIPVGLASLFQSTSTRISLTFLTFLASPYQAGVFSAAFRIPQSLNNVPTGIFSAVLPAMASHSSATRGFLRLFRRTLLLMVLLSVPIAVGFFLLGKPLVLFIFGADYAPSVPALRILCWSVIPIFVGMAFSHVLLSQARLVSRLPWATGLALAVNCTANLILIPRLESRGAAWALLISESVLAVGYMFAARSFVTAEQEPDPGFEAGHGPRIAFVVQRYGEGVIGGAEKLAREVAHGLSVKYCVDVLTTCARDYRTWANDYSEGTHRDGPVRVHRFHVAWHRQWGLFGRISGFLFALKKNLWLPGFFERLWVVGQGPYVPDLREFLERNGSRYEAVIFFTYLYYPTVFGLPVVANRSILVPTLHDEPPARFSVYQDLIRLPRHFLFMTDDEKDLARRLFGELDQPSEVAGFGVTLKPEHEAVGDYLLYLGRVEKGKGCPELFDYCRQAGVRLRVAGPSQILIPEGVEYLGLVDEARKDDLLADCRALVVPSTMESLSIVTLEAWSHGRPVIARTGSVAASLVRQSGGGYCYSSLDDFLRILESLDPDRGEAGRRFVREHYAEETVLEKFEMAIEKVRREDCD